MRYWSLNIVNHIANDARDPLASFRFIKL